MHGGSEGAHPYTWRSFRADLVAGLTVAAVAVPQAMAYALIADIDPVYGLYTAIVMTALGSIFGSSSHLINGPTNAISLVVFSAVAGLHLGEAERLQAVFLLSILVGAIQVLFYFFKLGDLTRYISESVILGFMLGAGLLVALSQIPSLLGLSPQGDGEDHLLLRLGETILHGGPIRLDALGLGLGTAALVVGLRALGRRLRFPLPDMLLALILASFAAHLLGWRQKAFSVPALLPAFHVPRIDSGWIRGLAGSALAVAVLGLLEAIAIAKSLAIRTRQSLDFNFQCLAEGLANLGGGFFQCMPGSGSLTRSAINFQAGAVSRLSGVLSALAVAACLLLFADLARFVPSPALAGILVVTAWRLIDRPRVLYCLRATPFDRKIALATAGAAIFISIEFSILIGIFLSFLFYVPRAARLMATELILSKERVLRERHPDDERCSKLVIMGLEGELFFGAAPEFDQVLGELSSRADQGARVIVLRLKRARNPDMVCLERLHHFLQEMQKRQVAVLLCGVRADFAEALERLNFEDCLPAERVFLEDSVPRTPGRPPEPSVFHLNGPETLTVREQKLTSTIRAVKQAYEMLGMDLCPTCPRRQELQQEREWYYMI